MQVVILGAVAAAASALGAVIVALVNRRSKSEDRSLQVVLEALAAARASSEEARKAEQACNQRLDTVQAQVDELRRRIDRNDNRFLTELSAHRHIKHDIFNALTVAEGGLLLVKPLVLDNKSEEFDLMRDFLTQWKPKGGELQDRNAALITRFEEET